MDRLSEALKAILAPLSFNQLIVGFSGGLDSSVLLHALSTLYPAKVSAWHVNHGLHCEDAEWEAYCRAIADQWQIPYQSRALTSQPQKGDSIEAWAREQRYAYFKNSLQPGDLLLTAHHLDDQIETFFINLLRGSGIFGLSSMEFIKSFGKGQLVRPFLSLTRYDLEAYAKAHQLTWLNDPSNDSKRFTRNFLRHELLPLLAQRWPNYRFLIQKTIQNCQDTRKVLDHYLEQEHHQANKIEYLKNLTPEHRALLLSQWLKKESGHQPNQRVVKELEKALFAKPDSYPEVDFQGFKIRRQHGILTLSSQ